MRTKTPKKSRALSQKTWSQDLMAVHGGTLGFEVLARRHAGLAKHLAGPWCSRCPAMVGEDDLIQEIWIEVWKGLCDWEPERGVPIAPYIRGRIHFRLLAHTKKLIRSRAKDVRYLREMIIEEKVVFVAGRALDGAGASGEWTTVSEPAPMDDWMDWTAAAARLVGGMTAKQASVIAGLLNEEVSESVTARVYGSKCLRPRKAALRAMAAATVLVSCGDETAAARSAERTTTDAPDEETGQEIETADDGGSWYDPAEAYAANAGEGQQG